MAKCKKCGETNWLLEKKEQRFYYAIIKTADELRWIEETKRRKTTPSKEITIICSKCDGHAADVADMDYTIKDKPFKVVWQTRFWENLGKN
jgi:hypothetical protein